CGGVLNVSEYGSVNSPGYPGVYPHNRTCTWIGCGGMLTTPSGTIRSPNFPDVYENNLNCEWLIRIHPDNRLLLTFKEFNLEIHQNCSFDYLEVYSGDTDSAPLLGRYCGNFIPQDLFSDTNQLLIRFKTDNSLVQGGFKMEYKTICGGVYSEFSGILSSPYYPDSYPAHAQCLYDIRLEPGYLVNVSFHFMEIEEHTDCQYDFLEIRDGDSEDSPLIGKLCGSSTPENIISSYNFLWMKFETDGSVQNRGFYAQYEALEIANYQFLDASQACGGTYYRESGVIRTPGFPNRYPHSAHCIWVLKGQNQRQISLNITNFQLEEHQNCRYDYLEIRNGEYETSPLVGKYCGTNILPRITSHSNVLRLEFKTDNSMSGQGFEIYFDSSATGCGGQLTSPRGSIVSPNYPQPYPYSADCEWLIQTSAGSLISLSIVDVDIEEHRECLYDYLQVFDGKTENSKSILRICNNQQSPGNLISSGNSLLVRFRSDSSHEAGGFHLSYQT
ncbi:dorsal-ventral patterning tolloid-like protein 1, partial [Nephila pilipes]